MKKPIRTFIWKFFKQVDANRFDKFQDICIQEGSRVDDVLEQFAVKYINTNDRGITLVGEKEMSEALKKKKLVFTRQTLIKKRQNNVLVDDEGNSLVFTDGRNVRYNYKGTLKFFKDNK